VKRGSAIRRMSLFGLVAALLLIAAIRPQLEAAAKPSPSPTPTASGPIPDTAVAYQMNASHSGTQTADSLAPGLVKKYA